MTRRERVLLEHRGAIRSAASRRRARSIALAGSVASGDDTDDSDYDFVVDFLPGVTLFDIGGLQVDLEELLDAKVDVVPADCIRDSHRGMLEDAIVL